MPVFLAHRRGGHATLSSFCRPLLSYTAVLLQSFVVKCTVICSTSFILRTSKCITYIPAIFRLCPWVLNERLVREHYRNGRDKDTLQRLEDCHIQCSYQLLHLCSVYIVRTIFFSSIDEKIDEYLVTHLFFDSDQDCWTSWWYLDKYWWAEPGRCKYLTTERFALCWQKKEGRSVFCWSMRYC